MKRLSSFLNKNNTAGLNAEGVEQMLSPRGGKRWIETQHGYGPLGRSLAKDSSSHAT